MIDKIEGIEATIGDTTIAGMPKQAEDTTLQYTELLPRGYLSVSQITQFLKCGKAYEGRYIEERVIPANNFTVQGRGVHKAAEHLHLSMIKDAENPISEEEMLDIYADCQTAESVDAVLIDDPNWDYVKDEGIGLTRVYRKGALGQLKDPKTGHLQPAVKPIAAERVLRVMIEPENSDPIPFMGIVDLEEPTSVIDVKTKRKASSQADVDNSIQLTMYAHILGKPEVGFAQVIKPSKTKPTRYLRTLSMRKKADADHALNIAADVAANIAAGNFPRTNPENWWCSGKWCPYWKSCRGKNL